MTFIQIDLQYQKPDLCAACGGGCCKSLPGGYHPADFGREAGEIESAVRAAVEVRTVAFDWWEGDPRQDPEGCPPDVAPLAEGEEPLSRCYFVRPAHVGNHGLYHPSWGHEGDCVNLTSSGCVLPHERRPTECRALEPMPGFPATCMPHLGAKRHAAIAWLPFQAFLASFPGAEVETDLGEMLGGYFGSLMRRLP